MEELMMECDMCHQTGVPLKTCSACKTVRYCSTACQTAGWRDHMAACKLLRKEKEKGKEKEKEQEKAKEATAAQGSGSGNGNGNGFGDMGSLLNVLMRPQPHPQSQPQPQTQSQPQSQSQPKPQRYVEVNMWNACFNGRREELQKILMQKGLDVNWANAKSGSTAVCVSAQKGHAECLSLMIQNGADVSKARNDGFAPIHMACQNGFYACAEILLDANGVGANVPMANEHGCTPAMIASQNGHVRILALLLAKGADPSLADSSGATAAHWASRYNYSKCLQLLVKRGVDICQKDKDGDTPLDLARLFKQPECIDLLLSAGAVGRAVEDLRPVSEADMKDNNDDVKDNVSRQVESRRCDLPACQASAADLNLPRLKKCGRCDVGRYCCQEHCNLHWPVHDSLCRELQRRCDRPKCGNRAEVMCHRCDVAAYCCQEHRRAHWLAHRSRCKELVSLRWIER